MSALLTLESEAWIGAETEGRGWGVGEAGGHGSFTVVWMDGKEEM